ncbi:hypothetical protein [Ferrimonas sp. YFM]|uniref:hypothetical protein n=1 Tax=Ferrimonas sp. YFM TaxID=3028878 RepID=UPI0025745FB3|nr:hypothetical protein [Ferrimonas sp. YFM]
MEELSEGAVKGLLRFVRAVILEGVCERLCFWVGLGSLRLITLGTYPKGKNIEDHQTFIVVFGLVVAMGLVIGTGVYLS